MTFLHVASTTASVLVLIFTIIATIFVLHADLPRVAKDEELEPRHKWAYVGLFIACFTLAIALFGFLFAWGRHLPVWDSIKLSEFVAYFGLVFIPIIYLGVTDEDRKRRQADQSMSQEEWLENIQQFQEVSRNSFTI